MPINKEISNKPALTELLIAMARRDYRLRREESASWRRKKKKQRNKQQKLKH
jgi:hypothetical protein